MKHTIYIGNTLEVLKTLPDESVDCIVTSPPYWGLRDYGEQTNTVWDGDPNCEHEFEIEIRKNPMDRGGKGQHDVGGIVGKMGKTIGTNTKVKSGFCKKCGAWYGQLGLEPTLDLYLNHMLQITAELKRVLKKTGVMFWNHGDNYSTSPPGNKKENWEKWANRGDGLIGRLAKRNSYGIAVVKTKIPQKCMCLQNYRLVLRMIDEQGWILRNVIIWHKPNHMPSSVKDRFTNAYEPVFFFSKNKKYWFDLDAVRVPHKNPNMVRKINKKTNLGTMGEAGLPPHMNSVLRDRKALYNHPLGKNPGDLWTIPTHPFPEAHFATYPEKLVEPMIKAGCPSMICKKCGFIRERIVERKGLPRDRSKDEDFLPDKERKEGRSDISGDKLRKWLLKNPPKFLGWTDCGCNAGWKAGIVLDPFAGSGTTMIVAEKLGRNSIGIELNPEYVEIIKKRFKHYLAQAKLNGNTELKVIHTGDANAI